MADPKKLPIKLSKNFWLSEFARSATAARMGIENIPSYAHAMNAKALCKHVLQPARDALGRIHMNSGYRGPELNKALRGAKRSDHLIAAAGDIVPKEKGVTLRRLGKYIQDNCKFKQLIWEHGSWLHVSYDDTKAPEDQRCEVLEAYFEAYTTWYGKRKVRTRYRPYIIV